MRRFLLGVALLSSGLISLVAVAFMEPLLVAMRCDHRARRERDQHDKLGEIGYDDNDPGLDVDECEHMTKGAPGSCARCEGT